jgi:hypothetical protein
LRSQESETVEGDTAGMLVEFSQKESEP